MARRLARAHRTLRRLGEQRRETRAETRRRVAQACRAVRGYNEELLRTKADWQAELSAAYDEAIGANESAARAWRLTHDWRWLAREAWRWVEYARVCMIAGRVAFAQMERRRDAACALRDADRRRLEHARGEIAALSAAVDAAIEDADYYRARLTAWEPVVRAAQAIDRDWCCDDCRAARNGSPEQNALADAFDAIPAEHRPEQDAEPSTGALRYSNNQTISGPNTSARDVEVFRVGEAERDMRCETCRHWRRHDYPSAQWGWCHHWGGERPPWSLCSDSWAAKGSEVRR